MFRFSIKTARGPIFGLALISLLTLNHCSPYHGSSGSLSGNTPPRLLHVTNGTSVGFFTPVGVYGFGTALNSVFSLGATSTAAAQMGQNASTGNFFIGSGGCTTGCNTVTGFNGYVGGYQFSSINSSQVTLQSTATPQGVAVDSVSGKLFIADPVFDLYYILQSQGLSYIAGTSGGFTGPDGTSAGLLAADTSKAIVAVTDAALGSVYFFKEADGSLVTTVPSTLYIVNGGCPNPANVSYVSINSAQHVAYVACGNTVVLITTASAAPAYRNGTLSNSVVTLSGITTISDLQAYSTATYAVGGSTVTSLSPTGSVLSTFNLSSGSCPAPTLSGVTWDGASTVYVSDTANSKIYLLDATTLQFKTGNCATSSFTPTGVGAPTKLSFF